MQVSKPSDRSILVTRTFGALRQRVFDALTKPAEVLRWNRPKQTALLTYEAELLVGAPFRYVFQRPSGAKLEVRGVYREVDPPERWVYTETYSFSPLSLLVTTVLDEMDGKTIMTQTILYPSPEERDADFDAVASSAIELYSKLEQYLNANQ